MFNELREELAKIALLEDEELDMLDDGRIGDEGAADDELFDDVDEDEEEYEDDIADDVANGRDEATPEEIEAVVEAILLAESEDMDYGDEDTVDDFEGSIGDRSDKYLYDDDDEDDEDDIDSVTNSASDEVFEDIEEDEEEEMDDLLEAMIGECGDCCDDEDCYDRAGRLHGDLHDIYGDSSDMPDRDVPPSPQYSILRGRGLAGRDRDFIDLGNGNYSRYGKVLLDRGILKNMTVDDDDYDEEGNAYDLYASAGNTYDDDENEEYYGVRSDAITSDLFGRHNINNVNASHLQDYYGAFGKVLPEDYDYYDDDDDYYDDGYLDESVAAFLGQYL